MDQTDSDSLQQLYSAQDAYNVISAPRQYDLDYNNMPSMQVPQQTVQTRTLLQPSRSQIQLIHPNVFYYRPPNDWYHYDIYCKPISSNTIIYLLNNSLNKDQLNE